MALWQHVPLIGGVTPFGVHVAPYFYWFFSITLILGKLNPLIWGYVAALLAVLTTLMIYKVGELIDSRKVGYIAATFWAFSYLANIYDRHFWGLTFGPLFTLFILFCLHEIVKAAKIKANKLYDLWTYALFLSLALIIHADLSFYVFLILTAITWVYFKLPFTKSTKVGILIIIISFIPLIIFDLRHNFANTKPLINYLKQEKLSRFEDQTKIDRNLIFPNSFARLVYTLGDNEVSKQYSYCPAFISEKNESIPKLLAVFFFALTAV